MSGPTRPPTKGDGRAPGRDRSSVDDARTRAAQVLERVERDGAYAAPTLSAALLREPALAPADRGLCTELVYGVLRTAPSLDAALERYTRAGSLGEMDPFSRAVFRIAAYQVMALSRIPARAAVHGAVETIKRTRSPGLARFANAVLRKLADAQGSAPGDDARQALALASVPASVFAALASGLGGREEAESVLRAMFARTPSMGLRVNGTRTDVDTVRARLEREVSHAVLERGTVLDDALRFSHGAHPARTEAYREGLFTVQEEGAQCVARAAGVQPGMRVLDACAGRGGKSTALAEAMRGEGVLHAVELYPEKCARIGLELARLGLRSERLAFEVAAADLSRGVGTLAPLVPPGGYDVVLLDAPCSGLGTIARRPDLLARMRLDDDALAWQRRDESDEEDELSNKRTNAPTGRIARDRAKPASERAALPTLQRELLAQAAKHVRVGGWLVYAVCSLTREEGDDVITAFRAREGAFTLCDADEARVRETRLRGASLTLRPDHDGTDGYLVFRLQRTR